MKKKDTMELTVDVEVVLSRRMKVTVPATFEECRLDNEKSVDVDIKEDDVLEAVKKEGIPSMRGWVMEDIKIDY